MNKDFHIEKNNRIIAIKKIYKKSLFNIDKIRIERDEEVSKIITSLDSYSIMKVLNEIKSMD
jgi:hypothetical protein